MRASRLRSVAAGAGVMLLSGCSMLSISGAPLWELAKAAGGMAAEAAQQEAGPPSHVLRHEPVVVTQLCIAFDPRTPTADFVPALQRVLLQHGVRSRVYELRTPRGQCAVWLEYQLQLDWDRRRLSEDYEAYLALAEITLRSSTGQVLATGRYRHDPHRLRDGKWAPLQDKLDPLVAALVARPS